MERLPCFQGPPKRTGAPWDQSQRGVGAIVAASMLLACSGTDDQKIPSSSDAAMTAPPSGSDAASDDGATCGQSAGACVNAADCAIDRTALDSQVSTCARSCTGSSKCTADCLRQQGLTSSCADCFGAVTQCGRDNCSAPCFADSSSTACRDCTQSSGCNEQFATCSGW
jgi:hypothetical protein